ncbi:MAG: cytochrome c family protein [Rhodospirillales bacterium]
MHISFMEKLGLGLLITAWLIYGGHNVGNMLVHADEGDVEALLLATEEDDGGATQVAEVEVDMATLLASADPAAGEKVFKKCASCHAFEAGAGNKVGPNLWGIVGREVAAAGGFEYSEALSSVGGTWTPERLAEFLESPKDFAPGNKMTFRGLSKAEQRAEVVVYLQTAN